MSLQELYISQHFAILNSFLSPTTFKDLVWRVNTFVFCLVYNKYLLPEFLYISYFRRRLFHVETQCSGWQWNTEQHCKHNKHLHYPLSQAITCYLRLISSSHRYKHCEQLHTWPWKLLANTGHQSILVVVLQGTSVVPTIGEFAMLSIQRSLEGSGGH